MTTNRHLDRLLGTADDLLASREAGSGLPDFSHYQGRELDFQREILKWTPWGEPDQPSQRKMHDLIWSNSQVVVRSANSIGKDAGVARDALTWVYVWGGTVLISGPTQRQVRDILFRKEIAKAFHRSKLPGDLYSDRLVVPSHPDMGIFGFTSSESSKLTGFHAPKVMVILTEGQAIEDFAWEGLMSCATSENDKIVAVGNPVLTTGKFREVSDSPSWAALAIPASAHPNVIQGREVIPGGVTRQWVELMKREWGEDSSIYRSRVLAEFPSGDEEGLFERDWLEAAAERWEGETRGDVSLTRMTELPPILSVDPAWHGADASVVAIRRGSRIFSFRDWRKADTTETVGRVVRIAREVGLRPGQDWQKPHGRIFVDSIGIGAGIHDGLKEHGYAVRGINFGAMARDSKQYLNLRAECYFHLAKRFEKGQISIPRDAELWEELLAMRWEPVSSGAVKIEAKEKLKGRLGRSPDRADALALAFADASTHSASTFAVSLV